MKKMALTILLTLFLLTTCSGGADHTTQQAETGSSEIDPAVQASEDLVRLVDEFFEREMELNLCDVLYFLSQKKINTSQARFRFA